MMPATRGVAVSFAAAGLTDTGRVRDANQDSYYVSDTLCVVADGLGGHAGGEVASALAVERVRDAFEAEPTFEGLCRGVDEAHRAIMERAAESSELLGMGTTLCALAATDTGPVVVNVGDSRAYRLADGRLVQLTEDDSLVYAAVAAGALTREQARRHPQRNIVTQALGLQPDLTVRAVRLSGGPARVLLCSDGLSEEVDDDEIAAVLAGTPEPAAAARALVTAACDHGGSDNITVVVADLS